MIRTFPTAIPSSRATISTTRRFAMLRSAFSRTDIKNVSGSLRVTFSSFAFATTRTFIYMAGPRGIEPRLIVLETIVLPLNYGPVRGILARKNRDENRKKVVYIRKKNSACAEFFYFFASLKATCLRSTLLYFLYSSLCSPDFDFLLRRVQ